MQRVTSTNKEPQPHQKQGLKKTSLNTDCHRHYLRYVGVIWFLLHVLQLLPTRVAQQNMYCISKSTMKHMQKQD